MNVGDSSLKLRVPVGRLQQAIARFNDLGTLLSQHIVVADLKAPLDRTETRITALRKVIAELEAKSSLTPAEQFKLDRAKRTVLRLTQTATRLVREGSFAQDLAPADDPQSSGKKRGARPLRQLPR